MRSLSLVLMLTGAMALSGAAYAQNGKRLSATRAAIRASQTFETSKEQRTGTGRWIEMHKHSIAGIRFGKLTAHQAMARLLEGKSVVVTPMQMENHYVGMMMGSIPVEAKARSSERVRSASELARWAGSVGLRFLRFEPELKYARPSAALPSIKGLTLVRGLDILPSTPPAPLRVPSMIRGLY